jgi:peptide deformylase
MNDDNAQMKIVTFPDPVLKTRAASVDRVDKDIRTLSDAMVQTMYAAPGIGLAANQVGVPRRLIVFNRTPGEDRKTTCALINPEIVSAEGEIVFEEACLSVVDFSAEVTRSARVLVRGVDLDEKPVEIEADGLLAICLQHEIDHLNGTLFIDRISSLKRAMYKKRLKKKLKDKDT